jgi:hypothetical protein
MKIATRKRIYHAVKIGADFVAYASTQIVTRVQHKSQSGVTDLLQVRQVSYHSLVSSNIMRTRKDEDEGRELNQ